MGGFAPRAACDAAVNRAQWLLIARASATGARCFLTEERIAPDLEPRVLAAAGD
jgi:hypothetical protein